MAMARSSVLMNCTRYHVRALHKNQETQCDSVSICCALPYLLRRALRLPRTTNFELEQPCLFNRVGGLHRDNQDYRGCRFWGGTPALSGNFDRYCAGSTCI